MPDIKPFRALMYNPEKFRDLSGVLAPPYDVISPKEQGAYYARSPWNIIRVILGREKRGDTEKSNRYTRARKFFKECCGKGVFVKDKTPSIYVYRQESGGSKRTGFLSALRVEEYGRGIYPHEDTYLRHRVDRLSLLRLCKANFNPIFFIYSPDSKAINRILRETVKGSPLETVELQGVRNKLWRVSDRRSLDTLAAEMKKRQVFIADGHHRYDVALKYSREEKSAACTLGLFVSMKDKGLNILPTHRVIKTDVRPDTPEFLKTAGNYFRITKPGSVSAMLRCLSPDLRGFGMYTAGGGFYLFRVRDAAGVSRMFSREVPPLWRRLNMVVLHRFFLNRLMKLGEVPGENIKYVTDACEAKKLVDSREYSAAFFLNPVKPDIVREIALSGEKMPHKATYFYPKPLSGMAIYKF